jgi:hypothetical protein
MLMLHLCLALLLSCLAGKTPEEIRKTFNIKVSQPVQPTHVQHFLTQSANAASTCQPVLGTHVQHGILQSKAPLGSSREERSSC